MTRPVSLMLVLTMLSAAACHVREPYEKPLTPVSVRVVETSIAPGGIRYSATIKPASEVSVAFRITGYVAEVLRVRDDDGGLRDVQQGDPVTRGTVLARLRADDYRMRVRQAEAQRDSAQATLDKARLDFDRAARLFASTSITKADYDAAKSRLDGTQAALAAALAQVDEAALALRDCDLRAPLTGIVLARRIERGSFAAPGGATFVLADTRSVKAVFGMADTQVHKITVGTPLALTAEAVPHTEIRGRVTGIAPAADPRARVFDVEVTIANDKGVLRPGMIAALNVAEPAQRSTGRPVVPIGAVVRGPGGEGGDEGYAVFVVETTEGQSVAHFRTVMLGDVVGNTVVVTAGVRPGETVVVTGATLVRDGEPVRVLQ